MTEKNSQALRQLIDAHSYAQEPKVIENLLNLADLDSNARDRITSQAIQLVTQIRALDRPGLMEVFLAEYGLSTQEGIALMCLSEALLRVPDAATIDALIEDKIAPSDWGKHMSHSTSPLVNASTWALMLTGKVLTSDQASIVGHLRGLVKRMGEPVIRTAVGRAMKEMGRQFVLGETITAGMKRAKIMQSKGYRYSYDMLGEAAHTDADAAQYHLSYSRAIASIAEDCVHKDIRKNPGVSVKLSALHPRYEVAQNDRVMTELVPRLGALAQLAKSANMALTIDAEEADRLSLSLDVIETVLQNPALRGWDGFGVVVQAYSKRASFVIDFLYDMAQRIDCKIMVRLVKGAYWDTEIKRAQVAGLSDFPVFTSKPATDLSYIANARKLLSMRDRIYPQFATHNAHTIATVLDLTNGDSNFEFQRLHGMGEALHDIVRSNHGSDCRIYAPVGAHRDLLAYLVRRLLENGANSSFVNQIVDLNIKPEVVAQDPLNHIFESKSYIKTGAQMFAPDRKNSLGFDLSDQTQLSKVLKARKAHKKTNWVAGQSLSDVTQYSINKALIKNPSNFNDLVGSVHPASPEVCEKAIKTAKSWDAPASDRAAILNSAADLYEAHSGEIFALLTRESGKTLPDALAEFREGIDFLRYYASQAPKGPPVGLFTCISPWNFPLAIFTGQVAAALSAGNAVLAKPAEQTPLIAAYLVDLLHAAGVPKSALQLLPGNGSIGALLCSDPRIDGVAFTGSTKTAMSIRAAMAQNLAPGAPLIAETGGLNAMIIDSTALLEQAVTAVIESAFKSAGQRCSALRCLYVQEDIADDFTQMLTGAMKELRVGDPWLLETDVGPVIDKSAQGVILEYINAAKKAGRVKYQQKAPLAGTFIPPTLIEVGGIEDLTHEVFGPVLHIARFAQHQLAEITENINATGYGLTFGLQTRIDDRVQYIADRIKAGNIYVNRNQIGAIVGSQPFGGEGLSGTGPKAGGPHYLSRFSRAAKGKAISHWDQNISIEILVKTLTESVPARPNQPTVLPGPTGESNQLSLHPKAPILCLGPGQQACDEQVTQIRKLGGYAVPVKGGIEPAGLINLPPIGGVIWWGDNGAARSYALALAKRAGPIVPLITSQPDMAHALCERHICIDTTAAGGNAELLSGLS